MPTLFLSTRIPRFLTTIGSLLFCLFTLSHFQTARAEIRAPTDPSIPQQATSQAATIAAPIAVTITIPSTATTTAVPPNFTEFPTKKTEYHHEWGQLFKQAHLNGTFVLLDGQTHRYHVYNAKRASTRMLPASTFKIFNSLVALDRGVVSSEREIIAWDGITRELPVWNRSMNMREANRVSNVPFYQEIARRIGKQRMQNALDNCAYGNHTIGTPDYFWLDNSLQISAKEQTDFLLRLARADLPFSALTIDTVQQMLITERNMQYVLYSKTGWGTAVKPGVGWWVGYLERDGKVYAFALNIDTADQKALALRIKIGKQILQQMQLLDQ